MESFNLALVTVVPMLVYMVVGGIIRRLNIFRQDQFRSLNTMIFKVFIPFSLFFNVYSLDLGSVIVPDLYLYCSLTVIISVLLTAVLLKRFVKSKKDWATLVQGVYRSNFVLFGGAIASALCDAEGVAMIAALSAVIIPIYNVAAVLLFELTRGGKVHAKNLIISIFKNPLIDASILAILFSLLGIRLPELLETPLKTLGSLSTPMALVALGGILSFSSVVEHRKLLITGVLGRLVVIPSIAIFIGILLGFRGNNLIAVLAVFASPTAVASAPMAQSMGGNGDLAGEIVVMTSAFCIITIFIYILLLSGFGLI